MTPGGFIFPDDEPLLNHLSNIRLSVDPNSNNYKLDFHFSPNDSIENACLSLAVEVDKNEDATKITSDPIQWRADKCLTHKTVKKTQTNKKTKKKREVEKKQKCESFFNFFKTRSVDDEESEEPEDDDDAGMGVFHDAQSVGDSLSVIKYMITKYNAAGFYGATIPDYDFDEGFGDDDEDGDDDDEDEENEPKPAKKDKKKAAAGGGDNKTAEECKKQ